MKRVVARARGFWNGASHRDLQNALGDTIVTQGGNDFIDGRLCFDLMDGGNDIDTMDVSFFSGAYVWNTAAGITNVSAAGEFAFNFENARTGAGADIITGNAAASARLAGLAS
jgi:hypothetical protein